MYIIFGYDHPDVEFEVRLLQKNLQRPIGRFLENYIVWFQISNQK